ncbi:MAG: hypothetical protein H7A24_01965 [Leptospiraceae bacterium]|nr:hypothetical protein [Leptospiraceae bacterium]MCP5510615.1 hypothetical protein [Leptospiraceae bacterium]
MDIIVGIESSPEEEQILSEQLKFLPHKIIVFNIMTRVEDYLKSSRPDLILIAIDPKNKKQLSFARKIKSDQAMTNVPIIALLKEKDEHFLLIYKRMGFSDYMIKPLKSEVLKAKIDNQLNLAQFNLPNVKHVEMERTHGICFFTFNSQLTKYILPELRRIFSPQLLKVISRDTICLDIRPLPLLSPEETIVLEKLIMVFNQKNKVSIIAGKFMGILLTHSNILDKANVFISMDDFNIFMKIVK